MKDLGRKRGKGFLLGLYQFVLLLKKNALLQVRIHIRVGMLESCLLVHVDQTASDHCY